MTPQSLYDLIQEMRVKKAEFGKFARFVNFNFEHTRTVFKTELIRSYAAFVDALDACIDDYNEAENATPKLLYSGLPAEDETVIADGKLAPKQQSEYRNAPLPSPDIDHEEIAKDVSNFTGRGLFPPDHH